MKKTAAFLFLAFICITIFPENNNFDISMLYSDWSSIGNTLRMKFREDKTADFEVKYSDAYYLFSGFFDLTNDTIIFNYKINKDQSWSRLKDIYPENNVAEIKVIMDDPSSIRYIYKPYKYYLKLTRLLWYNNGPGEIKRHFSENDLIYSKSYRFEKGTEFKLNDDKVIMMGEIEAVTTDNLKFREQPDINSRDYYVLFPNGKDLNFLPKGMKIILLYRTVNKERVKFWKNYWYYIKLDTLENYKVYYLDDEGNKKEILGNEFWIFGEFVGPK
jgi:hypothetical protein